MYPWVEQLLRWRAGDKERRLGGLILEVKGDFWGQLRSILRRNEREEDYVEIWQQAYTDLLKFRHPAPPGHGWLYDLLGGLSLHPGRLAKIDRDIRRLNAELNDPPEVLVIRNADYREHCIHKPWTHWFQEDVYHMAHPCEADLEAFLASRKVAYEVRKPKGAGWAARKR